MSRPVGYYVHHHGGGHRARAAALAQRLGPRLTGLSTLEPPPDWPGDWVRLPDDALETSDAAGADVVGDPTAGGALHWAPLGHAGYQRRMGEIAAWVARARPAAMVSDVSVEVLVLARLLGIPSIGVVLPGVRDDDAHLTGFAVADALVAFWPPGARGMLGGVPGPLRRKVTELGAVPMGSVTPRSGGPGRRVVVLLGSGGHDLDAERLRAAQEQTPEWSWTTLGPPPGTWVSDPAEWLGSADVVVTHAGQGSLSQVATARVPAIVVPQDRPYDEQRVCARALGAGPWPVVMADPWPGRGWAGLVRRASRLDGERWAGWVCDQAADRFADVVDRTARQAGQAADR